MKQKTSLVTISPKFELYTTQVEQYLKTRYSAKNYFSSKQNYVETDEKTSKKIKYEYYIRDYGSGPISSGIKSLDAFSRINTGIPYSSLSFYNTKLPYVNIESYKLYTTDEMAQFVINNLNMSDIYNELKLADPENVVDFYNMCVQIGTQIKTANFHILKNESSIRKKCKNLIKLWGSKWAY